MLVVFQEPTKPFTTLYRAVPLRGATDDRKEQDIILALMIPLVMIMLDVLVEHMPEGGFTKQNQPPTKASISLAIFGRPGAWQC